MNKYALVEGPNVAGHRVRHNDAKHLLIFDETVIACSAHEYLLLMQLLEATSYVTLAALVRRAFQSSLNRHTRHALAQQMSRVRAKVWPFHMDIFCVIGQGYILVSQPAFPASNEPGDQKG